MGFQSALERPERLRQEPRRHRQQRREREHGGLQGLARDLRRRVRELARRRRLRATSASAPRSPRSSSSSRRATSRVTNNPLDIAINGRGFFRFDNNGTTAYSRNGQMHVDANGYIVNSDNLKLTGYAVDANNNIVASAPVPLRLVDRATSAPSPTTAVRGTLNLDSRASADRAAFNPTNAVDLHELDLERDLRLARQLARAHDVLREDRDRRASGTCTRPSTAVRVDRRRPRRRRGQPASRSTSTSSGALTTAQPLDRRRSSPSPTAR